MLNKAAIPSTWMPGHRARLDGPTAALLRYALALIILCLAGCLYLLQANELARLNEEIQALEQRAAEIETHNLTLKLQLAQWNSPAYVRGEALRQNYVKDPSVLYVNLGASSGAPAAAAQPPTQTAQVSR